MQHSTTSRTNLYILQTVRQTYTFYRLFDKRIHFTDCSTNLHILQTVRQTYTFYRLIGTHVPVRWEGAGEEGEGQQAPTDPGTQLEHRRRSVPSTWLVLLPGLKSYVEHLEQGRKVSCSYIHMHMYMYVCCICTHILRCCD